MSLSILIPLPSSLITLFVAPLRADAKFARMKPMTTDSDHQQPQGAEPPPDTPDTASAPDDLPDDQATLHLRPDQVDADSVSISEAESDAETPTDSALEPPDTEANIETVVGALPDPLPQASLAALDAAGLRDLVASQAAAEEAERRAKPLPVYRPRYPMPPMSALRRGSLASVIPALLLMIVGAWLTLVYTGALSGLLPADFAPELLNFTPAGIAGIAIGIAAISLLAHWLASGRWSRGALVMALLLIGAAVLIGVSLLPGGLDLPRAYPLILVILAAALVIAGLLSRPPDRRVFAPAFLLALAAGIGMAFTLDLIPADILTAAAPFAPVVGALLLLIAIAPAIVRRRR